MGGGALFLKMGGGGPKVAMVFMRRGVQKNYRMWGCAPHAHHATIWETLNYAGDFPL